jgi:hypothetical protein
VRLLERLLEIVKRFGWHFALSIARMWWRITDIGDGDDARQILEAMDDHAAAQGFDDAASLGQRTTGAVAIY